jgi:hypothetical protein
VETPHRNPLSSANLPLAKRASKRFWAKVRKGDGCWEWTASQQNGYGAFGFGKRGQNVRAHRFSYFLAHGDVPDRKHVLHRCDNPRCVRPDHLFLGTDADNAADRDAKGRWHGGIGERAHKAKLTAREVVEIRQRYEEGGTSYPKLAREYGVTWPAIYAIVRRRSWKHVT